MLNKLKQLFSLSREKYDSETDHDGLPKISAYIPMPSVKPCKPNTEEQGAVPDKDISEPVLSFLRVFEENPKRFRLMRTKSYCTVTYKLLDTHTGDIFRIHISIYDLTTRYTERNCVIRSPSTEWCTDDELDLIISTLKKYYSARKEKLDAIKAKRKAKRNITERQRLCKIYGGSL